MTLNDLIICSQYIKEHKLNGDAEVVVFNTKTESYIGKVNKIKYSTNENKVIIHYE